MSGRAASGDPQRAEAASVAEAERVVEAAALCPGDTVLGLGTDLGLLAFAAHGRIGDGWVIAVDPSARALEELLRLAHDVNASGIMYLVGDAEVLPLPDAWVDAAALRSALARLADPWAAVHELARVLRPGGRFSSCEPLQRDAPRLATAVDWKPLGALGERVLALSAEASAEDPLLDPDELGHALAEAGFTDIDVAIDDAGEERLVTAESVEARLAAKRDADSPSLRERFEATFAPDEVDALVAHLKRLAGTTVRFEARQLFLKARRL